MYQSILLSIVALLGSWTKAASGFQIQNLDPLALDYKHCEIMLIIPVKVYSFIRAGYDAHFRSKIRRGYFDFAYFFLDLEWQGDWMELRREMNYWTKRIFIGQVFCFNIFTTRLSQIYRHSSEEKVYVGLYELVKIEHGIESREATLRICRD